jgi:hypothetical protein
MTTRIPTCPDEGGYLLIATGFAVMALAGIVSAMSYSTWRETRYQTNYTLGQQFAEAAAIAHNNAQRDFYTTGGGTSFTVPVAFPAFPAQMNGIQYTMQAYGVASAPFVSLAAGDQAASAILLLRPSLISTGQEPLASDMAAFIDGAASRGMKDVAVYGAVIPPDGQACGAGIAAVRWGNLNDYNEAKCMTQLDLDNLGITPQPGDIIVPAWEVAIARMDQRAVMRFPQPGHPDWMKMATTLTLQPGATITRAGNVETANMSVTDQVDIQTIAASGTSTMNNVIAGNIVLNNSFTQNNVNGGSQTVVGNVNATEINVNDDPGTGESRIIALTAQVTEPITNSGLILSGMADPLELTTAQISTTDTNVTVSGNIALQAASSTGCVGATCPTVPPMD